MVELNLTSQEFESETLADDHLLQACKAVVKDGFVVLNDAVNHEHLDAMRERMEADFEVADCTA